MRVVLLALVLSIGSPFQIRLKSPVDGLHYIAREVWMEADVASVEDAITFCTQFYPNIDTPSSTPEPAVCKALESKVELPAFGLSREGHHRASIWLSRLSAEMWQTDEALYTERMAEERETASTSSFYVGRSSLTSIVHGRSAGRVLEEGPATLVLGIKYGTHGDDCRISVAFDGELILDLPLRDLFKIDEEEVRISLTEGQSSRYLGEVHSLDPRDKLRLSAHLALQVISS